MCLESFTKCDGPTRGKRACALCTYVGPTVFFFLHKTYIVTIGSDLDPDPESLCRVHFKIRIQN